MVPPPMRYTSFTYQTNEPLALPSKPFQTTSPFCVSAAAIQMQGPAHEPSCFYGTVHKKAKNTSLKLISHQNF